MKQDKHQVCKNASCHGYNTRVTGGRVGGFCPICQHPTRTARSGLRTCLVMLALFTVACVCGGAAFCALD